MPERGAAHMLSHLIDEFIDVLRLTEGRSEHTVRAYRSDLCSLAEFAARRELGSRERIAPFGPHARAAIQVYLERARPVLSQREEIPVDSVFLNQYGLPLSTPAVRQMFKRYARRLQIHERVHPHALRHACATHTYNAGGDILAIKELLGHRDIATTLIYTEVDRSRVRETQRRFHPRG